MAGKKEKKSYEDENGNIDEKAFLDDWENWDGGGTEEDEDESQNSLLSRMFGGEKVTPEQAFINSVRSETSTKAWNSYAQRRAGVSSIKELWNKIVKTAENPKEMESLISGVKKELKEEQANYQKQQQMKISEQKDESFSRSQMSNEIKDMDTRKKNEQDFKAVNNGDFDQYAEAAAKQMGYDPETFKGIQNAGNSLANARLKDIQKEFAFNKGYGDFKGAKGSVEDYLEQDEYKEQAATAETAAKRGAADALMSAKKESDKKLADEAEAKEKADKEAKEKKQGQMKGIGAIVGAAGNVASKVARASKLSIG